MKLEKDEHQKVPYTRWDRVSELAMLLSIAVIGTDFVFLVLAWPRLPYSDGAAVLICAGAFIGRNVNTYALRCLIAVTLIGLVVLRLCSGLFPDVLIARHGSIASSDVAVLAGLILLCGALVIAAFLQSDKAIGNLKQAHDRSGF